MIKKFEAENKDRQLPMEIFSRCVKFSAKKPGGLITGKISETPIGGLGIPNDFCIFDRKIFESPECPTYYVSFDIKKIGSKKEQLKK